MKEIASFIREGAMAFLRREYSVLSIFALFVAVALFVSNYANGTQLVGISFLVGAVCSALAGFFGMRVATKANVRTTHAARESMSRALHIAFSGGTVMGMSGGGRGGLGRPRRRQRGRRGRDGRRSVRILRRRHHRRHGAGACFRTRSGIGRNCCCLSVE